jgi:site-specific recombinase XerD
MERISPPVVRADQVNPFTMQQVEDLLKATQHSKYARRDEAIVRFLLDTGVRATELCELRMRDLDLIEGQARILGKGNKVRVICFGRRTARVLRAYLRDEERTPDDAVFVSERGEGAGAKLTRWVSVR